MLEKFSKQTSRMGVFTMMSGVKKNAHPVYSSSDNSNYLWKEVSGWVVGADYTTNYKGIRTEASALTFGPLYF